MKFVIAHHFLIDRVNLFRVAFSVPTRQPYSRLVRPVLRVATGTLVLLAVLYCGLRVYTIFLARRVVALLDQADRIQIGASEESVLPFVTRFGAVKWDPKVSVRIDDCPVKADCEYERSHAPDYAYEVDLSPFHVFSQPDQKAEHLHRALTNFMIETPSSWRDPLSLRDWLVEVQIRIRAGRVDAVSTGLFVEGRTRWLGNSWELSREMRKPGIQSKAYAVDGTFLTFPGNGGAGTLHFLTPAATPEQFLAAQSFNSRCIGGLIPCRCPSDLTPRAFRYLAQHPETGNTTTTEGCQSGPSH